MKRRRRKYLVNNRDNRKPKRNKRKLDSSISASDSITTIPYGLRKKFEAEWEQSDVSKQKSRSRSKGPPSMPQFRNTFGPKEVKDLKKKKNKAQRK
jgi:hypothetical protein